ncbi:MAG: glycosyltransferase [Coriobacteriia bacterium]|nr:glycosyltransferase [Coriobacteriia bacterium]
MVDSRNTGRIAYLTLQATQEGQAAHAHVNEIVSGLRDLGWGVDLYEPTYTDANPGVLSRLAEFRTVQRLLATAVDRYDALYVRAHPFAFPAARAAAAAGVPVIHECNGPYQDVFAAWPAVRPLRPLIVYWQRTQYRRAAALIAVSDALAEWLRAEAPDVEVSVIPNGANTLLFSPDAPPRQGLPPRYVTFFGALAPWQGVDTMLEAAHSAEWPKDVALVIAGDGALRTSVERATRLSDRVVYLGTIPYREVPGLVTGSVAGLSVQDAVPGRPLPSAVKVFEILACGRPAIVSEASGTAAIVRAHSCGVVVPEGDAHAIARTVAEVAGQPEAATESGARGRRAVLAEATWTARSAATSRVIERVLERTRTV